MGPDHPGAVGTPATDDSEAIFTGLDRESPPKFPAPLPANRTGGLAEEPAQAAATWPIPPRTAPGSMEPQSTSWPGGSARLFGIDSQSR
jgi:hypothetical protein